MDLNYWCVNRFYRIADGNGSVGVTAGIQNNPVTGCTCCLNLVDQFTLHITLKVGNFYFRERIPEFRNVLVEPF